MREIPSIYASIPKNKKPKVVFCIPCSGVKPHPKTAESLEASLPSIEAAGWDHGLTFTRRNPYISGARAELTRKALDAKADVIFYIDHDISWDPSDILTVLETEGNVTAGVYRVRTDDQGEVLYMGAVQNHGPEQNYRPITREDGCIKAKVVPAGFLKVTSAAIDSFMRAYPELCYGPQFSLSIDLFHHGAHEGLWWGEDYAFSRNYTAKCGEIWIVPNLNIGHWSGDYCYKGNFHEYLLRQPGGSKAAA